MKYLLWVIGLLAAAAVWEMWRPREEPDPEQTPDGYGDDEAGG